MTEPFHRSPAHLQAHLPQAYSSQAQMQVRLALPQDRRQIRLLLRDYCHQTNCCPNYHQTSRSRTWAYFGLGLALSVVLHGLLLTGSLQLLCLGLLGLGGLVLISWLRLRLFADWQHYWVMEREQRLIACSRLTCHHTYAVLSDVVVAADWRQLGVGSQLLSGITLPSDRPIYLACRSELVEFYQRFGFQPFCPKALTAYLRRELGLQDRQLNVLCRALSPKS